MSRIARTTTISADRATVWAAIADLEHVADWNPNVAAASCAAATSGIGAVRQCHLSGGGAIHEVVSAWEVETRLRLAIGSHGAIRSADMGFDLAVAREGTTVTALADYHLAFGPVGPVIDHLAVKRQMTRMLDVALAGLKNTIEQEYTTTTTKETTT